MPNRSATHNATSKKNTNEEQRTKKNEYERRRKEKIRNDPILRERYRQKERERYARRKREGLLPRSKLDPRSLQILRNKNRISAKAYYRRKKAKTAAKCINPSNDNVLLAPQNLIEREISDNVETQQLRGETRHFNREVDQRALSGSQPDLQINTSMSSDRVLRSMRLNVSVADESEIPPFFLQSSSLQHSAPRSPCGTPSISSIHSVEISSCPSSPASTASSELKRDFQAKLRKYQRLKSKQVTDLRKKVAKIAKENEMYKKRYKRLSQLVKQSPKTMPLVQNDSCSPIKSNTDHKHKRIRSIVLKFYEDDENSTICPGKKYTVTKAGVKKQKRLLNATVKDLHLKYIRAGFPPISYVTFARMKPFWVIQPDVNKRNTCLCEKHDNMKLLIDTLKTNKIIKENTIFTMLDSLCCKKENVACLMRQCNNCKNKSIHYQEFSNATEVAHYAWEQNKSQYIKNGVEKTTTRTEKVRKYIKPLDLIKTFEKTLTPFMKHCGNIMNQTQAMKKIKSTMSVKDCVIHIDFSENYETKYGTEVQSVHFGGSRKQITLHTAVLYFKLDEVTKETQSFCTISTYLRHEAFEINCRLIIELG